MKRFKKDLNEAIQTTLGTEESIEFLGCPLSGRIKCQNKHSLQDTQRERGENRLGRNRLGRNRQPRFQKNKTSEAAVVCYIRMACEVLGPRGDEKNGCRDGWVACCSLNQKPSVISIFSFKGNHFNNLFEAAAALHFHRAGIMTYCRNVSQKETASCRVCCLMPCVTIWPTTSWPSHSSSQRQAHTGNSWAHQESCTCTSSCMWWP